MIPFSSIRKNNREEIITISDDDFFSKLLNNDPIFLPIKKIEFSGFNGLNEPLQALALGTKKYLNIECSDGITRLIESGQTYIFDLEKKTIEHIQYSEKKYENIVYGVTDILTAHAEVKQHNETAQINNAKSLSIKMMHKMRNVFLNNDNDNKSNTPKI